MSTKIALSFKTNSLVLKYTVPRLNITIPPPHYKNIVDRRFPTYPFV